MSEIYQQSTATIEGLTFAVNADVSRKRQSIAFIGQLDTGYVHAVIELIRAGNVVAEYPCDVGSLGISGFLSNAFPSGGLSVENAISIVLGTTGTFVEQSFVVSPRIVFDVCDTVRFRILKNGGAGEFRGYLAAFSDS